MCAATVVIDASAVACVGIDDFDLGTERFKNGFIYNTGGTIGAVHANVKTVETYFAEIIL